MNLITINDTEYLIFLPTEQPVKSSGHFEPWKLPSGGEGIEIELIKEISPHQTGESIKLACKECIDDPIDRQCGSCNLGQIQYSIGEIKLMQVAEHFWLLPDKLFNDNPELKQDSYLLISEIKRQSVNELL